MYTATLKSKEQVPQGLKLTFDFSDGTNSQTETVIPQDEAGLKHWLKARLSSLNSIDELETKYPIDSEVDPIDPVVEPTQAELDMKAWFRDFARMEQVQRLIDLGIVPADHAKVIALQTKLQTNLKPEYIDNL